MGSLYLCPYSEELIEFKAEEHKQPLIKLLNYYGLPYNASFTLCLFVVNSTTNYGFRKYAFEMCKKLARWKEDFVAIEQVNRSQDNQVAKDQNDFFEKLTQDVANLRNDSSQYHEIMQRIKKDVSHFLKTFSINLYTMIELYSLLPQSLQSSDLKQRLYNLALEKVQSENKDQLKMALSGVPDHSFNFLRKKFRI